MPLHTSFEFNARLHPDKIALIFETERITYEELNRAADNMSINLIKAGVKFGDIVPILLDRTPSLIVSIMALLKIGAVYTILDIKLFNEKLQSLFHFLGSSLVVVEDEHLIKQNILKTFTPIIDYRSTPEYPITSSNTDNSDPACIFFTSGSTGEPKAIVSPHKATLRLFTESSLLPFSDKSIVALAAALSWDAFSLELWGTLLKCGTLWIINESYMTPNLLRHGVSCHKLNKVWLTSSLFNSIVEEDIESFHGLSAIITGGERVSVNHVKKFLLYHPQIDLINGYGPVESTIFATIHKINIHDCDNNNGIPIGLPVPKTEVLILNDSHSQCQPNQVGEICIQGDGLAIGYLNNRMLTDQKFKPINLDQNNTLTYFTGDLGFIGDDGLFHYIGRKDRQIKVLGRIIDLGLLENKIDSLLIDYNVSARVIVKKDESDITTKLIAFLILRNKNSDEKDVREYLLSTLEQHESLYIIRFIDKFPLTSRGKIDDVELTKNIENFKYTQPFYQNSSSYIHNTISKIFYDVSGIQIDYDMVFQKSGISSLDIGRVCIRINKEFGLNIPLSAFYKYPTILFLGSYLENLRESNHLNHYTLNHMQILYLTKFYTSPNKPNYYCLMTWKIKGNLDIQRLQNAVNYTHMKNESLRSRYSLESIKHKAIDNSYINPPDIINLPSVNSEGNALLVLSKALGQNLNPIEGLIWKSGIVKLVTENVSFFCCVVHHIAFDGYSEHLLADDISYGYQNKEKSSYELPATSPVIHRKTRVVDSSETANIYDIITKLNACDKIFWTNEQNESSNYHHNISTILDSSLISKLDKIVKTRNLTKFNILFYCWVKALSRVTGNQNLCIGIPVRQRSAPHTNKRIGCYINMIYVALDNKCFNDKDGIENIQQKVQFSLKNQDISVMDIISDMHKESGDVSKLTQVLFALQDNPYPLMHLDNLEVNFIRQPYLELPFELHSEIWPKEDSSMELIMSYKDIISVDLVTRLAALFTEYLHKL